MLITEIPGTTRSTQVEVPRPRTGEPDVSSRADAATSSAQDPILVAARLEDSAAVLSWVGRLALLVVVGLVVLFVLLP